MMVASEATSTGTTMDDFLHFEMMGITHHNDFPKQMVRSPNECAELCRKNSACRSFDYGARNYVTGECWMSRANRASAGNAYTRWPLYDYYELKPAAERQTSTTKRPDPSTTKRPDPLVQIVGSLTISLSGVTQLQMEKATRKSLAAEFVVPERFVSLKVTESRRLVGAGELNRRLAGTWNVAFAIDVPASQKASVEAKALSLADDGASLEAAMVTHLKAAGVAAAVANSVSVSNTGTNAVVVETDAVTMASPMPGGNPPPAKAAREESETNALLWVLVAAGAVIICLLGIITMLLCRRGANPLAGQNKVVGVVGVHGIPVGQDLASTTVNKDHGGNIVTIGHPVVVSDKVVVTDIP